MKRALAIAVAVCTLGVAGFSQVGPITGSWTATVGLLPAPISLTSSLTLNYTVSGFTVTSVSDFGALGITGQRFALAGAFGPFTLAGNMWFLVAVPPAYARADLTASFDFGGIAITGTVRHWTGGNYGWPLAHLGAQTPAAGATGLQYILSTTVSPVTVRARFVDPSTGTLFQDLLVTLRGLPFCCGITYGIDFSFTRAGFDFLELTGINIPMGFGVSFDIAVRYTVTAKTITLTPRLADIAACVSVWFSPVTRDVRFWEGIELDGFSIRCALGDCNYLEYVHIFDRTGIPTAVLDKLSATLGENEYLELGFCGPGCCGGNWDVTLRVLWTTLTTAGVTPGIFGTTRLVGAVNIPIMPAFIAHLGFGMPSATAAAGAPPAVVTALAPTFTFGWTFRF